ncbi:ABC-2 family transporter protein [Amycolatopsis arida]|uniref:ABC-2 family transporter protein n=1 Tax=Amycolatopsis arida TaxID=587909 RepID=A0A1I5M372_9PSEU|nr:ABC transporter permease [Amycolatopsis arida]TDX93952.1 ABC-2 family transporter [Amycolatopsis arida]SFP04002.1 ABC-2 family transporter protein [Amycolatopsis arida]
MNDVLGSEWLKVRTVRSTYYLVGASVLALVVGGVVSFLMTADWDSTAPAERASFGAADASVLSIPVTEFCLGVLAALAIAGEYTTGMIRTSLTAVPQRLRFFAAKSAVVAALALVVGLVIAALSAMVTALVVGDRPAPIAPWPSLGEAVPPVLAGGLSIMVVALVAVGVGAAVRSSAGALVTVTLVLFVLPVVALLLPGPWNARAYAVMLPNLAEQLAGDVTDPVLSPLGAAIAMVVWAATALGAGAYTLARRDA